MPENEWFTSTNGSVWVQPDGPNTQVYWLGCADLGDTTVPRSEVTRSKCWNASGQQIVGAKTKAFADDPTSSIEIAVGKTASWLQSHGDCVMPVYALQKDCGNHDAYDGYQRAQVFEGATITNESETGTAMRRGDDTDNLKTFDISADFWLEVYPLVASRKVAATTAAANDITSCTPRKCRDTCGAADEACDVMFAGLDNVGAAAPQVLESFDNGETWAATTADPGLPISNAIQSLVCFPVDDLTNRVLVFRDDAAAAGAGAVFSYSDDLGNTWTDITPGAFGATEAAADSGSLFAWDYRNIWAGTTDNGIWISADGGATWTLQETSTQDINYIDGLNADVLLAVGDANVIEYTVDGGANWTNFVGPSAGDALLCCQILTRANWWVANDDAELWFSEDTGVTWTQRAYTAPVGSVVVGINDMHFWDEYVGYFILEYTTGGNEHSALYRTFDGGFNWERYQVDVPDFDAGGFNAITVCDPNNVFAVGEAMTTTSIWKFAP